MSFPFVNLDSPTHLALHWGWLLVTSANFIVYVAIVVIFVLGVTVRLPGTKRDLASAEGPRAEVAPPQQRSAPDQTSEKEVRT